MIRINGTSPWRRDGKFIEWIFDVGELNFDYVFVLNCYLKELSGAGYIHNGILDYQYFDGTFHMNCQVIKVLNGRLEQSDYEYLYKRSCARLVKEGYKEILESSTKPQNLSSGAWCIIRKSKVLP